MAYAKYLNGARSGSTAHNHAESAFITPKASAPWIELDAPSTARMMPSKMIRRWERLLGYERLLSEGKLAYL